MLKSQVILFIGLAVFFQRLSICFSNHHQFSRLSPFLDSLPAPIGAGTAVSYRVRYWSAAAYMRWFPVTCKCPSASPSILSTMLADWIFYGQRCEMPATLSQFAELVCCLIKHHCHRGWFSFSLIACERHHSLSALLCHIRNNRI